MCQEYFGSTLKSYFAPLPPGGQKVKGRLYIVGKSAEIINNSKGSVLPISYLGGHTEKCHHQYDLLYMSLTYFTVALFFEINSVFISLCINVCYG